MFIRQNKKVISFATLLSRSLCGLVFFFIVCVLSLPPPLFSRFFLLLFISHSIRVLLHHLCLSIAYVIMASAHSHKIVLKKFPLCSAKRACNMTTGKLLEKCNKSTWIKTSLFHINIHIHIKEARNHLKEAICANILLKHWWRIYSI